MTYYDACGCGLPQPHATAAKRKSLNLTYYMRLNRPPLRFSLQWLFGHHLKMDVYNFVKIATLCAAESEGLLDAPGRTRAYSVHPYNRGRDPFPRFYDNIRKHQDKFFTYYRMSVPSFDHLLEVLRPAITKSETSFGKPISAEKRLTITLR